MALKIANVLPKSIIATILHNLLRSVTQKGAEISLFKICGNAIVENVEFRHFPGTQRVGEDW